MATTRATTVNPNVQRAILRQQVDLFRVEAASRRRVLNLLQRLQSELTGRLASQDVTKFNKQRLTQLLRQTTDTVDQYYAKAKEIGRQSAKAVAKAASSHAGDVLDKTFVAINLDTALPSDTALSRIADNALIMNAPSAEWWDRQARDTAFRFASAVRQGITAGDTVDGIVARVAGRSGHPGIMDVSKANARSLVHTSLMEVAAEARRETFKQNEDVVQGIRQLSTLDSDTTEICIAYDGAEYNLDGDPINGTTLPYNGGVPRHWGCRSVEVPITLTFKELGINAPEPDAGTRASADGPKPGSYTFEDFLNDHTPAEQDELLGPGRAELWREGKLTLQQLLDQNGNPLTLAELQDKYAAVIAEPKAVYQAAVKYVTGVGEDQGIEAAAVYDRYGKELLRKTGGPHSVSFTSSELSQMKDTTLVHNHPSQEGVLSLSREDFDMSSAAGLRSIVAVASDGTEFTGRGLVGERINSAAYTLASEAAYQSIQSVRSIALSSEAAFARNTMYQHATNQALADLGFLQDYAVTKAGPQFTRVTSKYAEQLNAAINAAKVALQSRDWNA